MVIWLTVPGPRKGIFSATKTPTILILCFVLRCWKIVIGFIYFKCLVFVIFTVSSTLNVLPMTAMVKLNGTNYQKWKKTLVMNLTFMKLDLALEIDPPEKPTDDNNVDVKILYENWKHSNKCCMMMMENCMDAAIYASIPKVDIAKGLLEEIGKKFIKFDRNEKHQYLDLLNNTKYDGVKGVRDHIMLLSSYYNKLKGLKMDIGEEFLIYTIMKSLPSQFDNIRSSLNIKKKGCSLEELTAILVKEEDDIKLNRSRSVAMVSHQGDKFKNFFQEQGQGFKQNRKKFYGIKSKGPKDGAYHMGERKE